MKYYPQLKTTTAEMKALRHLKKREEVSPILQITKPRISKLDPIEALERHISRAFNSIGKNRSVIVGITNDETFQDANLNQYVLDSSNDYESWRTRLSLIKEQHPHNHIVPCVVGLPNAGILEQYVGQITRLSNDFRSIAIRIPSSLHDTFDGLDRLSSILGLRDLPRESYIIFDFGYVNPVDRNRFEQVLRLLNTAIEDVGLKSVCIPLFSSCPANFPMKKRESKAIQNIDMIEYEIADTIRFMNNLTYGDYGYIHPTRQEGGGFWYPRVDYPSIKQNQCFYSRFFNKETWTENGKLRIRTTLPNEEAYRELSKVIVDTDFYRDDNVQSWGRDRIMLNTTKDEITGKSPQHYISIRSNIHMEHILSR